MLNTLDNYFLLKEVIKVTNRPKEYYINNFKDNIIVLRHDRYIEKKYIEYKYRSKLSDLYNHIPLKDFSDYIGLTMGLLEKRIKFMKDNQSIRIFDYAEIENKLYVIVDDELKHYLKNYTAFIVHTFKNYKGCEIKFSKLFSTYIIGFY